LTFVPVQVIFTVAMKFLRTISLRLFVTGSFLLASLGIPLFQHVCNTMGTRKVFSVCSMHKQEKAKKKPCCMEDEEESAPAQNAVSQNGPGSKSCCHEVDVSIRIHDAFTPSYTSEIKVLAPVDVFPTASGLLAVLFQKSALNITQFQDSSPPPADDKYQLYSALLI
jgi:hypothetical protein